MRRQLLVEPAADAVAVARRVCGLHAQVTSCSGLIAGVRSAGTPDLATALWTDRTLVRTWAMRGTLHLLPADELDLWAGAFTARESRRRFPPSWEREHGVTAEQLHAITEAVGEVLGAAPLTRSELAAAVGDHLRDPALTGPMSTGWGALLKPAAARGLLCSGPATDDGVTFVAPASWLGRSVEPVPAAEAERATLLRFLTANGPATAVDVSRWAGEQPGPAKRLLRENADALTAVEISGEAGFVVRAEDVDELASVPDGGTDPTDAPVLLPGFDPWVLSPLSHRTRAVPDGRAAEVSRTAGWISPVLVVDSRVAGVWAHTVRGELATVTVTPFAPLSGAVRLAMEGYADRFASLLGVGAVEVVSR